MDYVWLRFPYKFQIWGWFRQVPGKTKNHLLLSTHLFGFLLRFGSLQLLVDPRPVLWRALLSNPTWHLHVEVPVRLRGCAHWGPAHQYPSLLQVPGTPRIISENILGSNSRTTQVSFLGSHRELHIWVPVWFVDIQVRLCGGVWTWMCGLGYLLLCILKTPHKVEKAGREG
jgi:hypothetical protein